MFWNAIALVNVEWIISQMHTILVWIFCLIVLKFLSRGVKHTYVVVIIYTTNIVIHLTKSCPKLKIHTTVTKSEIVKIMWSKTSVATNDNNNTSTYPLIQQMENNWCIKDANMTANEFRKYTSNIGWKKNCNIIENNLLNSKIDFNLSKIFIRCFFTL